MFEASRAENGETQLYTQGFCHVFAVALHRMTGWGILVSLDEDEAYWQNPDDPDDFLPSVLHVWCVDPEGNAWDVKGRRPLEAVHAELDGWLGHVGRHGSDEVGNESGLMAWTDPPAGMEGSGDVDRPLCSFTEEDVEEARETALRALGAMEGFPVPAARAVL